MRAGGCQPAVGILLDTNTAIAVLEGEEKVLLNLEQASEVFVPSIVLGELFFGTAKSGRPTENLARVERFAPESSILPCDLDAAWEYGRERQRVRETGRPLPENDVWIAAVAKRHALVLITRDRHFSEVDDLTAVEW